MILVDTSVWVAILRDKTGEVVQHFRTRIGTDIYVLSRFTQLELLQGAKDEREWERLDDYLATQYYLEATERTWKEAARIYFELRRRGITLSSPIDCCIAQIAMESDAILLHQDQDFEKIAGIRPLTAEQFRPKGSTRA
jgi:predicted nucleic acid-binding protein